MRTRQRSETHAVRCFVVRCDEYEQAHLTRDAAEAHVRSIADAGACTLTHTIEQRSVRWGTLGLPEHRAAPTQITDRVANRAAAR